MKNFHRALVVIFLASLTHSELSWALLPPHAIPRVNSQRSQAEGIYEGGGKSKANLESLRFAPHNSEGYERWVVDFSDIVKREVGKVAPRFQVRYEKSERDADDEILRPARFLFLLRSIRRNYLDSGKVAALAKRSRYVKDIVIYPTIEQGDLAIELLLKDDVSFSAHQPLDKEGRLVLDMGAKARVHSHSRLSNH